MPNPRLEAAKERLRCRQPKGLWCVAHDSPDGPSEGDYEPSELNPCDLARALLRVLETCQRAQQETGGPHREGRVHTEGYQLCAEAVEEEILAALEPNRKEEGPMVGGDRRWSR